MQDVCLVNVEYDVRGTLIRYIRSCQPLQQCASVQKDHCTNDKCCSQAPDKCLCRPGNKALLPYGYMCVLCWSQCHVACILERGRLGPTDSTRITFGWLRGSVVERRSSAGVLSLSCDRPAADGWPFMWVNHPLQASQLGQLSLSSFRGR